ncbi:hypothetical protein N1851_030237 [Merluccius polli]|uniref:Transposase domain-containing protein n=1 Tax=Merluccius polli TaxID=89951 RepID=A0AA47M618_MERPO|nr:hypothetical protein N1851_030237 [Merluccius polli]
MDRKYNRDWKRSNKRLRLFIEEGDDNIDKLDSDTPGEGEEAPDCATTSGSNVLTSETSPSAAEVVATTAENIDVNPVDSDDDNVYDYGFNEHMHSSDSEPELIGACAAPGVEVQTLDQELAKWAVETRQTDHAINSLLGILRGHGHNFPKDKRTLLATPRQVEVKDKCNGQYIYYGVEQGVTRYLSVCPEFTGDIEPFGNIDGTPLFKSSRTELWPILAKFHDSQPFLVGLFCGVGKPKPVAEYLLDLVEELKHLQTNGIMYGGVMHRFTLRGFVCDAPARAFLKNIKGHNAIEGCERCVEKAVRSNNKQTFLSTATHESRTDLGFSQLQYPEHQHGPSPLLDAGILCIQQFPLDYMHLISLGVTKRLLHFLLNGPDVCRLRPRAREQLSERLVMLRGAMPAEFARQPRSLKELDRWKATELRQFILYTGSVVLEGVVDDAYYEHFLTLSVATSILLESDDSKRQTYLPYAKELMEHFVRNSAELYSNDFPVYNVHSLRHVADDAAYFGSSLNDISCFPFENHLQSLKKMVRKSCNPIAQITKRVAERQHVQSDILRPKYKGHFVSAKPPNFCFLLKNEDFVFIRENRRQ